MKFFLFILAVQIRPGSSLTTSRTCISTFNGTCSGATYCAASWLLQDNGKWTPGGQGCILTTVIPDTVNEWPAIVEGGKQIDFLCNENYCNGIPPPKTLKTFPATTCNYLNKTSGKTTTCMGASCINHNNSRILCDPVYPVRSGLAKLCSNYTGVYDNTTSGGESQEYHGVYCTCMNTPQCNDAALETWGIQHMMTPNVQCYLGPNREPAMGTHCSIVKEARGLILWDATIETQITFAAGEMGCTKFYGGYYNPQHFEIAEVCICNTDMCNKAFFPPSSANYLTYGFAQIMGAVIALLSYNCIKC